MSQQQQQQQEHVSASEVVLRAISEKLPPMIEISPDLFTAPALEDDVVRELVGRPGRPIRSVVNLRRADEGVDFSGLKSILRDAHVTYLNVPMSLEDALQEGFLDAVVAAISALPSPTLMFCRSNVRARVIGDLYKAANFVVEDAGKLHQDVEKAMQKEPAALREAFSQLVDRMLAQEEEREEVGAHLTPMYAGQLVVGGQVSNEELEAAVAKYGIRSVINLRSPDELGFRADEAALCARLGINYQVVATSILENPSPEVAKLILDRTVAAEAPVLLHCRKGRRSKFIAELLKGRLIDVDVQGVTRVSADFYIAPQLDESSLRTALASGLRTVINLRMEGEGDFEWEERMCREADAVYHHVPIGGASLADQKRMTEVMSFIDKSPRPVLVHCASAMRARVATLMHMGTRSQVNLAALKERLNLPESHKFSAHVDAFVENAVVALKDDQRLSQISPDLWISGQVEPADFERLGSLGIRSVLSIRSPDEQGVLPNERQLVEEAGMSFFSVPTKSGVRPTPEQLEEIRAILSEAPKPTLLHCRKRYRSAIVSDNL